MFFAAIFFRYCGRLIDPWLDLAVDGVLDMSGNTGPKQSNLACHIAEPQALGRQEKHPYARGPTAVAMPRTLAVGWDGQVLPGAYLRAPGKLSRSPLGLPKTVR
jgi:hypothetical protein